MLCMKSQIPLLLLFLFSILIVEVHEANCARPLYLFCLSKENYTSNGPYSTNLKDLFNLLSTIVPPTGYGTGSTGEGEDRVNGLALCRGDVLAENCKSCVIDGSKYLLQRCTNRKAAIVWYDNCLMKYSDMNFFGKIDNKNRFYMFNVEDVDGDPATFNSKVNEILGELSREASGNPRLYAIGELELEGSEKLYGLAQCTQDLSNLDCKSCLDDAMSLLPDCCDGKKGGRVVGGSCYIRYELYPIVHT